jgi:hypothetical protein
MIAALVNEIGPTTYADIGCAEGLLSTLTPDSTYIGVDFIKPDIDPPFSFYQCDLNNDPLPVALGHVDLVTCSGILEYIEDLPEFFTKLHDRIVPTSTVIISYFNMNHISRILGLVSGRTFSTHPDWRNFLSPKDLQSTIRKAGFEINKIIPVGVSLGTSPSVKNNTDGDIFMPSDFKGSYLFSHQFIFTISKNINNGC